MRYGLLLFLNLALFARGADVVSTTVLDVLPGFRGTIFQDAQGNWLAWSSERGVADGVITKVTPNGHTVLFARVFAAATIAGVANDAAGNIYVTGQSAAGMPATAGVFQADGGPGYLAKLSSSGELLFVARINATPTALAVGSTGDVFVAGIALGDFITTPEAYQKQYSKFPTLGCDPAFSISCGDAFVMRVTGDGKQVVYATYFGGRDRETVVDLEVDSLGNAYFAGETLSTDFTTTQGAFDTTFGGQLRLTFTIAYGDSYAAKLDPTGHTLLWSTFIGGVRSGEAIYGIEVTGPDDVFLAGTTGSQDFPTTPGAFRPTFSGNPPGLPSNSGESFLLRLGPQGAAVFSTFLGGGADFLRVTAGSGKVYVLSRGLTEPVYAGGPLSPCRPVSAGLVEFDGTTGFPAASVFGPWLWDGRLILNNAKRVVVTGLPYGIGLNVPPDRPFAAEIDFLRESGARADCLVNAAFLRDGRPNAEPITRVAPGEIVTFFGSRMGPEKGVIASIGSFGLPLELGGTSITIAGQRMPLLYVSGAQINAILPFGLAQGEAEVRITVGSQTQISQVLVVPRQPGVFNLGGTTHAAALGEDGRILTVNNAAERGEIVAIFASGFGAFTQNPPDGSVTPLTPPWPSLLLPAGLRYQFGQTEKPLEVFYAGPAPGLIAGAIQLNIRVPSDIPFGQLLVVVASDGLLAQVPLK